MQRVLVSLEW